MRTRLTTSHAGTRLVVSGAVAPSDIVRLKDRLVETVSAAGDAWTLDATKVSTSDVQLLQLLVAAVATSKMSGKRMMLAAAPGSPVFELAQATGLLVALGIGDVADETGVTR
jgi:ABC-type transporter Mla MlaB component